MRFAGSRSKPQLRRTTLYVFVVASICWIVAACVFVVPAPNGGAAVPKLEEPVTDLAKVIPKPRETEMKALPTQGLFLWPCGI